MPALRLDPDYTEAYYGLADILEDPGESPLETLAHKEIRTKVERELQQVPEPYRTTVVLRDIEGLSYEEIAEVLDISLGTVKSRLIRGREALKKRLESFVREPFAVTCFASRRPDSGWTQEYGGDTQAIAGHRKGFEGYYAVAPPEFEVAAFDLEAAADTMRPYLERLRGLVKLMDANNGNFSESFPPEFLITNDDLFAAR